MKTVSIFVFAVVFASAAHARGAHSESHAMRPDSSPTMAWKGDAGLGDRDISRNSDRRDDRMRDRRERETMRLEAEATKLQNQINALEIQRAEALVGKALPLTPFQVKELAFDKQRFVRIQAVLAANGGIGGRAA